MTPEVDDVSTVAPLSLAGHDAHAGSSLGDPIMMGTVCGFLNVASPDHLVMLITLTTLTMPLVAFRTGAAWGAGHSIGVILLGCIGLFVGKLIPHHITAQWEYYGDYLIGFSMIFVAAYFMCKESQFLRTSEDGTTVANCACHGGDAGYPSRPAASRSALGKGKGKKFCDSFGAASACIEEATESTPLVDHSQHDFGHDAKGILIGIFQGLCCPMGVVTITYLPGQGAKSVVLFCISDVLWTIMAAAALSALWAFLTRSSMACTANPHIIYRASCLVAFTIGVVWIAANYMHVLDKINYAEMHHH